ncbi:phytoene desaturase [Paenibacillus phyllosphaerae]|uniref:4,4'-diaponeurosporene oxygenase n=1 Tax=Paenibacillus phyllosphaerae TaxID=274593 RepID=A0A7W5B3A2_9BACL|nr:phytoene desaturase family protein [Paenibacillus phyllosphaerae]MBB3112896.1 phytoene desaturase [Paenibacillus phyllosphaerae]
MKQAVVIGGGLGGLATAIRLAHGGYAVTLLEQQPAVGGKLQRVKLGAYTFDRGPSTITMKHAFEGLFRSVGRRFEDYARFYPVESGTRNYFADGSRVDVSLDIARMEQQIASYSAADARNLRPFLKEAKLLYELADAHFMNRLLISARDMFNVGLVTSLFRIRPLTTLQQRLMKYFQHPNTHALFGRYATYVGSDPAQAPAIFTMLAHVETMLGVYGVQGGTYAIVQAYERLARELGVNIVTNTKAERIVVRGNQVHGVESSQAYYPADLVVANGDVLTVHQTLLAPSHRRGMTQERIDRYEPSLSGFVLLAGVKQRYDMLGHHTVFFPKHYGREFYDIFQRKQAPQDPAIYLCHTGYAEAGMAPQGHSNLFILVNAPYLSSTWDWEERGANYQRHVLQLLEQRGLAGLTEQVEQLAVYTPDQLQRDTSAHRGAIYGISSNGVHQTFARPSNKSDINGLWFVGGTTHPGGGTPMVSLSGQLVAEAILAEADR